MVGRSNFMEVGGVGRRGLGERKRKMEVIMIKDVE